MVADRRIILASLTALPVAIAGYMVGKRIWATRKYRWLPTESAPHEAPVFVVNGDLQLADGGTSYVPDKRMAGKGWGEIGSSDIVGDDEKALPASVSLSWFSYLDDRFYAGQFALPVDRLEALFAHDVPMPPSEPQSRAAFRYVVFGMAPGGNVSVWASTGRVIREVARFRAAPADLPWTNVIATPEPTRVTHVREVLEGKQTPEQVALQRSPERMALWNDFPRRLAWTPQLTGVDPHGAILWIKGLNGEKDWADLADPHRGGEPLPLTLPMPANLTLSWRAGIDRHSADITLDPVEVVAVFRKLAAGDRQESVALVLKPVDDGKNVDVSLRRGELIHQFARTTVKVFSAG